VHLAQWPACRGRKGVPAMEQVMHLQFLPEGKYVS